MNYKKTMSKQNTERQEALYRFLLSRGDNWTSMEQATDSVKEYPAFFTSHYHNAPAADLGYRADQRQRQLCQDHRLRQPRHQARS